MTPALSAIAWPSAGPVLVVHPQEGDLAPELGVHLLQVGHLPHARRAPRGEEVHDERSAPVVGERAPSCRRSARIRRSGRTCRAGSSPSGSLRSVAGLSSPLPPVNTSSGDDHDRGDHDSEEDAPSDRFAAYGGVHPDEARGRSRGGRFDRSGIDRRRFDRSGIGLAAIRPQGGRGSRAASPRPALGGDRCRTVRPSG